MMVRLQITIPATELERFNLAAGARGMTQAEYLVALMNLHDAIRQVADDEVARDPLRTSSLIMSDILVPMGLQTVVR